MLKLNNIFSFLIFALLASCTSVSVMTTTNRFDTPEVAGKTKAHIHPIAIEGANLIEITDDINKRLPSTNSPRIEYLPWYRFEAGTGLGSHFEVELQLLSKAPAMVEFKYQFLGEPRLTAKEGNFSGAVTLGGGARFQVEDITFSGSKNKENDLNYYALDTAVIFGYRVIDFILIYGGPYYKPYFFNGTYSTYSSSDYETRSLLAEDSYEGRILTYGWSLGVQFLFTEKLHLKVEGAYSMVKAGPTKKGGIFPGFQFGINF